MAKAKRSLPPTLPPCSSRLPFPTPHFLGLKASSAEFGRLNSAAFARLRGLKLRAMSRLRRLVLLGPIPLRPLQCPVRWRRRGARRGGPCLGGPSLESGHAAPSPLRRPEPSSLHHHEQRSPCGRCLASCPWSRIHVLSSPIVGMCLLPTRCYRQDLLGSLAEFFQPGLKAVESRVVCRWRAPSLP